MTALAVLPIEVPDISILGSWDWTVFDVFSSKSDPQRSASRLIAGGADDIVVVFLVLVGLPVVSLGASLFFLLRSLCSCFFKVFPVTHWSCVSA